MFTECKFFKSSPLSCRPPEAAARRCFHPGVDFAKPGSSHAKMQKGRTSELAACLLRGAGELVSS